MLKENRTSKLVMYQEMSLFQYFGLPAYLRSINFKLFQMHNLGLENIAYQHAARAL